MIMMDSKLFCHFPAHRKIEMLFKIQTETMFCNFFGYFWTPNFYFLLRKEAKKIHAAKRTKS